jgi:xylulose-5-phosphate/fructose-6-phosphate phosphoketolase
VLNGMSRYHLCIEALRRVPRMQERAPGLIAECNAMIAAATEYSRTNFADLPEINDWVWPGN